MYELDTTFSPLPPALMDPRLFDVQTDVQPRSVAQVIEKWQKRLGLSHWKIIAGDPQRFDGDDVDAHIHRKVDELTAIVHVSPQAPAGQIERLVLHEMLHIPVGELVDPLRHVGEFSVGMLDLLGVMEERFINILCNALLPDTPWEPVDPTIRQKFEFDPVPEAA